MPPITVGRFRLLLSWDDLTFIAIPDAILNAFFVAIDTNRMIRYRWARELGFNQFYFWLDAVICGVCIVLDVFIAVLCARGYIMDKRKNPIAVNWLSLLRQLLAFPLFVIYSVVVFKWLFGKTSNLFDNHEAIARNFTMEEIGGILAQGTYNIQVHDVEGWGPVMANQPACMIIAQFLIVFRLVTSLVGLACCCLFLLPLETQGKMAILTTSCLLRLVGVKHQLVEAIVTILYEVTQDVWAYASPSDLAYGLILVQGRQLQGLLRSAFTDSSDEGYSRDESAASWNSQLESADGSGSDVEYGRLSASLERATALRGAGGRQPTLFDPSSERDLEVLRQIVYYSPFAFGLYGFGMEVFMNSVYEYSSIPSPCKTVHAICRASPCKQKAPAKEATVEEDLCCNLNENALRRLLADNADQFGTEEAELVWATWENRGSGTSPPLALILDHANRKVVIAVRGTMDFKDCIADLAAEPAFFDPLGEASRKRERDFEDDVDFFAHSTMISCAEDAVERIEEPLKDVLAADSLANGWGVLCVGHSLGAGVACLLALLLRGDESIPTSDVLYIGYEPPGGLLSKKLSDSAARLGFLAAVGANDWISRLSIRAVQDLRERILNQLLKCDRSKFQLFLLCSSESLRRCRCCCLLSPLTRLLEYFAGGRLGEDMGPSPRELHSQAAQPYRVAYSSIRAQHRAERQEIEDFDDHLTIPLDNRFFNELWAPGRIVYFKPVSESPWCCGLYDVSDQWTAEWAEPEDLHELIISVRSVEMHFPNLLRDVYRSAATRLGARIIADDDDA